MSNRSPFLAANRRSQEDAQRMLRKHANLYVEEKLRQSKSNIQEVKIVYKAGWWRNKPDEVAISNVIKQYKNAGWRCLDREEDFSLADWKYYTVLKFQP